MPKINEIRQKLATKERRLSHKDAVRNYLRGRLYDFQYAVTLTFNPYIKVMTEKGAHYKVTNKEDVIASAAKFKRSLNAIALGSSAKRYNKSLNYFFVIEGERSTKHLHLHLAVGGELRKIHRCEFMDAVKSAASLCPLMGSKHDVQIVDSGWFEYITKEIGIHDTDNVLWELA